MTDIVLFFFLCVLFVFFLAFFHALRPMHFARVLCRLSPLSSRASPAALGSALAPVCKCAWIRLCAGGKRRDKWPDVCAENQTCHVYFFCNMVLDTGSRFSLHDDCPYRAFVSRAAERRRGTGREGEEKGGRREEEKAERTKRYREIKRARGGEVDEAEKNAGIQRRKWVRARENGREREKKKIQSQYFILFGFFTNTAG